MLHMLPTNMASPANGHSYFFRTILAISNKLQPLEEALTNIFIPALTGRDSISSLERELLALPPRLGGLGIFKPGIEAALQHRYSCKVTVTANLVSKIITQSHDFSYEDSCDQLSAKWKSRKIRNNFKKKLLLT